MIDLKYDLTLRKAFFHLHGCSAVHVKTVPVTELWLGKTVWEGKVEVYDLFAHPTATRGYAWAYDKAKVTEIVAVMELPPVISPKTAVQAAIIEKLRGESRN